MSRHKRKRYTRCTVPIFLDGRELLVPAYVESEWAARGALGLARGDMVAHEDHPESALLFRHGHTFSRGERFVTMIYAAPPAPAEAAHDSGDEVEEPGVRDDDSQASWERDADWWKR